MKTIGIFLVAMALTPFTHAQQNKDAVEKADAANEQKADQHIVDEDDAEFLVKATDGRMMDIMEGSLAIQQATAAPLKAYGRMIVRDQYIMLDAIKQVAGKRKITLPDDISGEKNKGYKKLADFSGEKFDRKFIRMMIIDHKRDIKLFRKAKRSADKDVQKLAAEQLPMIEEHLKQIRDIRKNL